MSKPTKQESTNNILDYCAALKDRIINPQPEITLLKIVSAGRGIFCAKNFTYMDLFNPHN